MVRGLELTDALQIGILVIIALAAAIVIYLTIKASRAQKNSPDYIPGDGIAAKLRRWTGRESTRGEYSTQLQPTESAPSLIRVRRDGGTSRDRSREPSQDRSRDIEMGLEANRDSTATTNGAGVDRNTSVRSIMTLPAYSPAARDSEQILGREGDRGGIDVVIEYPENVDEEEARREEEMESLYQIRRARRQEQSEREERRRARREARARGDFATLQRLQQESQQRADNPLASQQLIAEHQAADRQRRVSSVQYADLGVARHDGSRIRANSTDSDNRPLLDSAASIAGSSVRPVPPLNSMHTRGRSASSVLSMSTTGSDEIFNPSVHRNNSAETEDYEVISLDNRSRTSSIGRRTPTPGIPEEGEVGVNPEAGRSSGDLGEQPIPHEDPPQYIEGDGWGEAPPYESPIRTRAPVLPIPSALREGNLPSIEIQVASPVSRTNSRSPARGPARSIDEATRR